MQTFARILFGFAILASGICALIYHHLDQLNGLPQSTLAPLMAAIEVLGSIAILWPQPGRPNALPIATVYFIFAALALPAIFRQPLVYNGYGNLFEQLSLACGALLLTAAPQTRISRIAFYGFAVCLLSFALEQIFYLGATASLVPRWMPPNQRFWAIATTVFFALAAVALLTGIRARLAAQLTAAMLLGFALLTWLPIVVAQPHGFFNWAETFETLAIAASAWLSASSVPPQLLDR